MEFTVTGYYKVKEEGEYPWPCEAQPSRTIELWADDILTKDEETGRFTKQTGLGCMNIILEDDQVIGPIDKEIKLVMM